MNIFNQILICLSQHVSTLLYFILINNISNIFPFVKLQSHRTTPSPAPIFYFVFVRILLAGVILFLFNTAYGRIKRIQKKDWPKFLLLAFFEPFIYFICETYGLKVTGSPTLSAMV
ncbi:MAG: EamA family transporter, partial [Bacteroidaceae bacterium]|nr:EamA family transporter [Bacteroidaceae bacterium]